MKNKNLFFNFKNKVILLTGSEGKLGSEIKKNFIDLGAKVYGIDINKKSKNKIFRANISNEQSVNKVLCFVGLVFLKL